MVSKLKIILSFSITAVALVVLFLFAVNTGSLKVTPIELFKGLFISYNENVATIFDLRFPRMQFWEEQPPQFPAYCCKL